MLIAGENYKVNILILLMEHEIDATIHTIETLLPNIESNTVISVLLNGAHSTKLKRLFSEQPHIQYYESEHNLGVAGGRNYLLATKECKSADIVFILDNDVIPPTDYIHNLATFLINQPDAGIIGAAIVDVNTLKYSFSRKHLNNRGVFGHKICTITSSEIKELFLADPVNTVLFHIGMHPNYHYAYFSLRPAFNSLKKIFCKLLKISIPHDTPSLVNNDYYLKLIKNGTDKYNVSNVAGCSQVFRRHLVDTIGGYNNDHNPYGLEDVDFSIRSLKSGYKNYIDTNSWLLHCTDARHVKRDFYVKLKRQYRCLTILSASVYQKPNKGKWVINKLIYGNFLVDVIQFFKTKPIDNLKARLAGYKEGLSVLQKSLANKK